MMAKKLKSYLDARGVQYHVLPHQERFTSPEIAQSLEVPGRMLAKVVIVTVGDRKMMAVLDANTRVDLDAIARAAGGTEARLATEEEFGTIFPDCEVGAMPPFGNLYDLSVVVDRPLTKDEEIVFEAGNHHEAIKLRYADFERLVHPQVSDIGVR